VKPAPQEAAPVELLAWVERPVVLVERAWVGCELRRAVWRFVPKWQNPKTGLERGGQI
jgi:hypothetical protein